MLTELQAGQSSWPKELVWDQAGGLFYLFICLFLFISKALGEIS